MTTLSILLLTLDSPSLTKSPPKFSSVSEERHLRNRCPSTATENLTRTLVCMKFLLISQRTLTSTSMVTIKSVFMLLTIGLMPQLLGIQELLRFGTRKVSIKVLTMAFNPTTSLCLPLTSPTLLRSLRSPQFSLSSVQPSSSSLSSGTSPTCSVPAVPTSLACPSGACCSL